MVTYSDLIQFCILMFSSFINIPYLFIHFKSFIGMYRHIENVKFFRNIFLRNFKRFSEEPLFYPYYIVFQCKNLLLSKYKIFFYTIL